MDEYPESGWREKCEGLRGEDNGGLGMDYILYYYYYWTDVEVLAFSKYA
jgi:hypothetical protein